ncbi:MAG: class I adenylate cyclase, partial [Pseudomonadota bacterium]
DRFAGAEVHFFPMELKNIRADDFGVVSGESSGTALGKLLKEEFYRSLTLIAGQTPLWWVMPPGVDDDNYARLAELAYRSGRLDSVNMVDMGNMHGISLGEFYGAAVWQINKTMGSPFKSILKMALLEEYMFNHGSKGLLCTELKQRLVSNEAETDILDPYILMFDRASAYLSEQNRQEDLDLLRRSLYLKSGANLVLADYRRTELPRKTRVMVRLVRQWGWNHKLVEQLNHYHNWSFEEALQFSRETNNFIVRAYKNVSAQLNKQKEQVGLTISQRDLTVLGRKLFIFYSKRTNKVDSTKNVIEAPPSLAVLTLHPRLNREGRKLWEAYPALLSRGAVMTAVDLKGTTHLTELLIWLVNNQLYSPDTSINLNPGPRKLNINCTVPDIQKLLKVMKIFFPPYKHSEVDEEELLKKPVINKMLLVINLDEPDKTTGISTVDTCYQNNWGEVFFKGYDNSQEGLSIGRNLVRKRYAYDPLAAMANFKVFLPDRLFKKTLTPRLDKHFGFKVVI